MLFVVVVDGAVDGAVVFVVKVVDVVKGAVVLEAHMEPPH